MSLKARLNHLEKNMKQEPKFQYESFQVVSERIDEQEQLYILAAEGDFAACLRYCEITKEAEENIMYEYLEMYIKILAQREGKKSNFMTKTEIDLAHENIMAVYRYLEAMKEDPQAKQPVLQTNKTPGE